jgi:hypothetical protein
MTEPTIAGLTERQKILCDLIWQCNTKEQALEFIRNLPTAADRRDARCLAQIMVYEVLEERISDYAESAQAVISRCCS